MTTITKGLRLLLVAWALSAYSPPASADGVSHNPPPATERTEQKAREPAGSPEMGVLIIIGVVGFLVLVAWLVSRVGDDNRSGGDSTLI